MPNRKYTDRELAYSLRGASYLVDDYLSYNKYENLGILPSPETYLNRFDSWTDAKMAAGLETKLPPKKGRSHDFRDRSEREKACTWYYNYLEQNDCCRCGESDPRSLQFHHVGEKLFEISQGVSNKSVGELKDESDKCVVLCANCHRKEHSYWPPRQVSRYILKDNNEIL